MNSASLLKLGGWCAGPFFLPNVGQQEWTWAAGLGCRPSRALEKKAVLFFFFFAQIKISIIYDSEIVHIKI